MFNIKYIFNILNKKIMQPPPPPSLDSLFQHRQSRLSSLPEELQTEIKGQVRDHRARELSEQIVRAETEYA
jgi:hypothetical protein